jgi:hypothetical protein
MLPSLIGMGVNYRDDAGGHDRRTKIGVITEATIVDHEGGKAIAVAGLLYENDFPDEVAVIRANKHELGMSFELVFAKVEDYTADVWTITEGYYTGAAILRRDAAAYEATRLAAAGEIKMDEKRLREILAEALGEFKTTVLDPAVAEIKAAAAEAKTTADQALTAAKAATPTPAAAAGTPDVEAIAAKAAEAAVTKVLATITPKLEAAAAGAGNTELAGKVDKLVGDMVTLLASAKGNGERHITVPSATVTLLASHGLEVDKDGAKFLSSEIDTIMEKIPGLSRVQRTAMKMQLQAAGKLKDAGNSAA